MPSALIMRSLAMLLRRQHERLCGLDALADVQSFRNTVATLREDLPELPHTVAEVVELIEAEIARRDEVRARAERVSSNGL